MSELIYDKMLNGEAKLAVIGLGYVGLPILLNLANKYPTHGYDINVKRINNLKKGIDTFNEYKKKHLKKLQGNVIECPLVQVAFRFGPSPHPNLLQTHSQQSSRTPCSTQKICNEKPSLFTPKINLFGPPKRYDFLTLFLPDCALATQTWVQEAHKK